jgi:hypothetical protein
VGAATTGAFLEVVANYWGLLGSGSNPATTGVGVFLVVAATTGIFLVEIATAGIFLIIV